MNAEHAATIHIVDDDAAVRAGVSLLVKSCGWEPAPYASAEEFLARYHRDGAGCLLLDIQMPGITGADLVPMLSSLAIDLPVIIITAYGSHPLTERAKEAGVVAVIEKPFRDELLVQTIERALAAL